MNQLQPKQSNLVKLELFQKTILKILSLPINTPDHTAYILSGLLPVEAIIDIKEYKFCIKIKMSSDQAHLHHEIQQIVGCMQFVLLL
jgi:hypothetical protein